jgi:hypothetical protein
MQLAPLPIRSRGQDIISPLFSLTHIDTLEPSNLVSSLPGNNTSLLSLLNHVGMFSDRGKVCVFFIDGKDHDQQHSDNGMEMESSTVNSNSDCWIPFRFLDDRQI